jgi:hypothetical protein
LDIVKFTPHIAEALIALSYIGSEKLPELAQDALEAGYDGPATRRMAGLVQANGFEIDELLPRFMHESNMHVISCEQAAFTLALDPRSGAAAEAR